jgi:protein-tyrosine-phosphatase
MPAPYIRGKRYIDWDLPDPKGQPLEAVRALRDDIKARVESCGRLQAAGEDPEQWLI